MARPQTLYRAPKGSTLLIGARLTSAEVAAGTPPLLREAGRLLTCSAAMEAEPTRRMEWSVENCSTTEASRSYPEKALTVTAALRSAADVENIVLAWQGDSVAEVGGQSIVDEPTRDDLTDGDIHVLALPSDGTATITAAIEGTNWEWMNGSAQIIRFLDVSGLTLPLLVSYDTAASEEVGLMSNMGQPRHVIVQAVNAEGQCTQEFMELYHVVPNSDFEDALGVEPESTDESPLTISMTAYAHPDMAADPVLGTIGRIIR